MEVRGGDYRLIYQPIKEVIRIDLITVGGRSGAYVH
jgi:mRNA-degrading endonuclease RelE of RelBE toxin-antitoxin system